MSRPFVQALDVRSSGFQLETELNVVAAYLKASVREVPIDYLERPENSVSKLNTIRDGLRILAFALRNWLTFAPLQPFLILSTVMLLITSLLGYRVVLGFLQTGWPYSTTAVAAAFCGLITALSIFFGIALEVISDNARRTEIAHFLEAKRQWNKALDG